LNHETEKHMRARHLFAPGALLSILAACAASGSGAPGAATSPGLAAEDTTAALEEREVEDAPELLFRDQVGRDIVREYPESLRQSGVEGTVVLRMRVNVRGGTNSVSIARSSGYPQLDEAARGVARRMRFKPAQLNGGPVASWVTLPVDFRIFL
jgi:protein TonB